MGKYIFLSTPVIYKKLKELLSKGVVFSSNIKDKYVCIFGKSKVLALKVNNQWYVNSENWGVNDPKILYDLNISAITPGGLALKEMKLHIKNYTSLWPTLNTHLNKSIKSGYNSGLLYARVGLYNHKVYHYDMNAAYGYAFKEAYVPIGLPEVISGFVPPDESHLCIYFMDLNVEYTNPNIFPYLVNSNDLFYMPSEIIDNTGFQSIYKVITCTEYEDLIKDYNVEQETLYTLKFKKAKGLFDGFVNKLSHLKNNSEGDARTVYKSVLASLAGKLAQEIKEIRVPTNLNEFGTVEYITIAKEPEYINPAVSLFIVDFVRKVMRDEIKKHYKDIILVDTDGFISTKPLDINLSKETGGWKIKEYDRVIINGKRSYFYEINNEVHSSISGFGDVCEDKINKIDFNELMNFMKLGKPLPLQKKILYNGEYKWVQLNVHLGKEKNEKK